MADIYPVESVRRQTTFDVSRSSRRATTSCLRNLNSPAALARRALLRLDVRRADDFAPFLSLVGHQLAELGWRERERCATQFVKAFLDLRVSNRRGDLRIELINDGGRRVPRSPDTKPIARLVARQVLTDCRNIRQNVGARRGRDGEAPQLPGPHIFN